MTENSRFIRVPLLAALMGLLASLTAPSQAATWYVRPDGGGSGTGWGDALGSFRAAIAAATAGDEIWGAGGVYRQSITLKAGIALYGGFAGTETSREDRDFVSNPTILDAAGIRVEGTEDVTIDGFTLRNGRGASSGGGIYFRNVSSATVSNCTITNNTIVGDSNLRGAGVYCLSSSPTLTNCTISGNRAWGNGGGVYCDRSSPTLINCKISGNTASYGSGVYCDRSSPTLTHCTISDNTAYSGGGVYCDSSSPTLTNCTISDNTAYSGGGVYCDSSSPTLTNCILWNPGNEIYVFRGAPVVRYSCAQGGYPGEGNINAYPRFVDPQKGDWRLRDGSPCIGRGADIGLPFNGGRPEMGSWEAPATYSLGPPIHLPQILRVDHTALPGGDGLSWETALSSISEALFLSSISDEVWVAAGTYYESITMDADIALYGGFAASETVRGDRDFASNPTILDATGLNRPVIRAIETNGITIDGFTIRNGNTSGPGGGIVFDNVSSAMVSNCTISGNTSNESAGGVHCFMSSPSLTNCTISNNTANHNGGGVHCHEFSSPTLTYCTITGNTARNGGGVVCRESSSPTLTHCTISDNTANRNGGGIYCSASSPTLTHCTITGNTANEDGGGVTCFVSSSPKLTDCTISGNTAISGGGLYTSSSSPILTYCTISVNTASYGGGLYSSSSSPTLTHCTISGNTAVSGGGLYTSSSSTSLTNCILWNVGNEISMVSVEPVVRYSCVQGGYSGEGNIYAHPQFVDPLNGDWRLRDGSPCIDRGADVGLPFNGAGPDMGSWEAPEAYVHGPPDHVPQLLRVDHTAPPGGDGLSWDTAFRSIGEALFFSSISDEIWVASGTYNESIAINTGLALYGGFAATETVREDRNSASNPTILDATGLNRRVITAYRSEGVKIDGFTIQNGISVGAGGGIHFVSVSSATVSNCTITNNTVTGEFVGGGGGGVYCHNSSPTLTNCIILSNTATDRDGGGVLCRESSSPTLIHCTISGNIANRDGGGVYCSSSSSPTLTLCTIMENTAKRTGGGVHCIETSSPMLTDCTISCNTARGGGGVACFSSSSPMLTDCRITGNTAMVTDGGGVLCSSSSPTLTHCTITGNTANDGGGGVYCSSSSPTLTHCTITGNTANEDGGGVYCWSSSPTVTNCTITGNTANEDGGGVYVWSSSPTLTHCTISGNMANDDGGGLYCRFSAPTLIHCTITGNTATGSGGGVYCTSSSATLTNCILWNPGNEISVVSGAPVVRYSCVQGGYPGEGNIDAYPRFVDPMNGDWRLRDGSPCIDRGTEVGLPFNGAGPDIGSWESPESYTQEPPSHSPRLFHVDAAAHPGGDGLTWESAFSSVGEALLHSSTAVEIWVSAGNFYESIYLEGGSALYGGFAGTETVREDRVFASNPTILDGTGLNTRVLTADGTNGITIDGFTIRNGNTTASGGGIYFNNVSSATVSNCTISGNTADEDGGGVACFSSSTPTLIHCTMSGNSSNRDGGGVYCSSSSPTLNDCTISDNTASINGGGVACFSSSSPTLMHCTISGNTANDNGGGLACSSSSSPSLTDCTIWGNTATGSSSSGGGLYLSGSSSSPRLTDCKIADNMASRGGGVYFLSTSSTLSRCTISGNTASSFGGGIYCSLSSPALTHCTISGNTGISGGGVYCRFSSPALTDCTFSGNTANSGSGVFCSSSSSPILTNCILWNPGNEIRVDSGAPVVGYSCVQGGYPGEGNIDAYPQFVDPVNGDWRLRDGSPCIDRGTDVGLPFNGDAPDMGSWEAPETYLQGSPESFPQLFHVDADASKGGDGLTWETAFSSVGEALVHSSSSVEIWVAAGTYYESIHLEVRSALYGGFAGTETSRQDRDVMANSTVLDATGLNQRVITADRTNGVTIDGFTIRNGNAAASGGGIYFDSVSSATVSNCTISDNTADENGGGVAYFSSSSPTLIHCTISDNTADENGGGVACFSSSSPTLIHCKMSGNMANRDGGGVYCSSSSPTLTSCTISDNAVTGSFASGGGIACVFLSSPTLTHCAISGNTANRNGGGVACSENSSPTMIHCTISDNTAISRGGGVYCTNGSSPSVTYCTISGNTVTGSFGSGGGVYCRSSSPSLTECTISGNTANTEGGGVYCQVSSSPTLTQCTISDNTADENGGGIHCADRSSPTLTQCTITGNTANDNGGGMHCNDRSSPTLTNCTITGNTAIDNGGGVYVLELSSSPTLINCVLWNGRDEVFLESATAEVTFSTVQGGYPGEGNIDDDPRFVDPEQSDYRLSMGSPCIDSGSNGAVLRLGPSQLAMGDHLGRMRIWDGDADGSAVVDMGAFEYGPPPFVGDIVGDSRVNHLDLFRFQQVWKQEGDGALPAADQDGDRTIGASDLVILLHTWGAVTGP